METRYNLKSPGERGWGGWAAGRGPWRPGAAPRPARVPPVLAATPGSRFTRGRCGSRGAGRRAGRPLRSPRPAVAPWLLTSLPCPCRVELATVLPRAGVQATSAGSTGPVPPGCTRIQDPLRRCRATFVRCLTRVLRDLSLKYPISVFGEEQNYRH